MAWSKDGVRRQLLQPLRIAQGRIRRLRVAAEGCLCLAHDSAACNVALRRSMTRNGVVGVRKEEEDGEAWK